LKKTICRSIPDNSVLTANQCSSYVKLYGPYIIDLIASKTNTADICSTLGLCEDPLDSNKYNTIWPSISDTKVEYEVHNTLNKIGQKSLYKLFLGNPTFTTCGEDQLEVILSKTSKGACNLALEVTNKKQYVSVARCPISAIECGEDIKEPGRGIWYYISITAMEVNNVCSFNLNATFFKDTKTPPIYSHMHLTAGLLIFFLLPILCLSALCLCCCCIRKRRNNKSTGYQHVETESNDIALQSMPAPIPVDAAQLPMGYYYVPVAQSTQLPRTAYPMVYTTQEL